VTERDGEPRIEISPEPEPEERDAILRAAARAQASDAGRSAWWREGVRDALRETPARPAP
jgi:hypothetical protein